MLDFSTSLDYKASSISSNPGFLSKFIEFNKNLTNVSNREQNIQNSKKSRIRGGSIGSQRRGSLQIPTGKIFSSISELNEKSDISETPREGVVLETTNNLLKYQLNHDFDELLTKQCDSFGFTMDECFGEKLMMVGDKRKLKRNSSETDLYLNRKVSDGEFWGDEDYE